MNVLLRSGSFTACVATPSTKISPVLVVASRLFHSSTVNFALPKKKLKPKPPMSMINGVPKWIVDRELMQQEKVVLAGKFEELSKQEVVHMPKPKMQAWVTDLAQNPVGIVDLNPAVWNQEIRKDIVHRVVRMQRNSWMQGTHKGKRRGEVRGGGIKPRPQKGGGNARQGSIRSPLWVGGGIAHAPLPNDHLHDLPMKVIKKGIMIALTAKYQEGNLYVVDGCALESHKSKTLATLLDNWDIGPVSFIHGLTELDNNFALAARNMKDFELYSPRAIGVYQIVKRAQVFITKQALVELESHLLALPGLNMAAHPRRRHVIPPHENFEPKKLAEIILG